MIKHILFDFDGTLVQSKEVFVTVFNQLASRHCFRRLEREDMEKIRGLPFRERCQYLQIPLYRLPLLVAESYGLYKLFLADLLLVEGVQEVLMELNNKGYSLSILSSNAESNIRAFLEKHDLNFINSVFCSSNLFGKDRMIRKFLCRKKLLPAEVMYVGDELRDITASKKCGVKIMWVGWGFDSLDLALKEGPDFIAHQPQEILHAL